MGTRSHYETKRGELCASVDRAARIDLDAVPESAAAARHYARDTLTRWGMTELADDAQAVPTELVSNAIAAAIRADTEHSVIFTLHDRPPELWIHVWDHGPGEPARRMAATGEESGRGLAIVDTLTSRQWGWYPTPVSGGKVVWAALTGDCRDRRQ